MTKLKQPIVVTIENLASAVGLAETLANQPGENYTERARRLARHSIETETQFKAPGVPVTLLDVIADQLTAQGINWQTWEPPQPILIDGRPVTATADGSIQVNGVTVDRTTLEAILKLSSEAMGNAEPEWPKWFLEPDSTVYQMFSSERGKAMPKGCFNWKVAELEKMNCKQITPAQAREILEGGR